MSQKFCGYCGAKIDANTGLCPNCNSTANTTIPAPKKKRSKVIIIVAIVLSVLIALSGASFLLAYFTVLNIPFLSNVISDKSSADDQFISFSEGFTDIKVTDEKSAIEAVESVNLPGIENAETDLKIEKTEKIGSDVYYRIQQYHNDIPVYGRGVSLLSDKNGIATALTGNSIEIKKSFNRNKKINCDKINDNISDYFSQNKNIDFLQEIKEHIDEYYIYLFNNEEYLALIIPINTSVFIINAENCEIINVTSSIMENATNKQKCRDVNNNYEFNGLLDFEKNKYVAIDTDRNIELYTYNSQISYFRDASCDLVKSEFEPEIVQSDDTIFGNTEEEANLNYEKGLKFLNAVGNVYDYYYDKFGKKNDKYTIYYDDGFDDGTNALGGIGEIFIGYEYDQVEYDLFGHEYTHGISREIVNWAEISKCSATKDIPGAINEGYSDIFGELIEAYMLNKDPDWINGDRNIANPMSNDYPAKITDKQYEHIGTKDNNDEYWAMQIYNKKGKVINKTDYAHGFSTVVSHTAYLMWNGFNQQDFKIGNDKLAELWYRGLFLLQSNCDFKQLANAITLTAHHMFRNNELSSKQLACVLTAFQSAGITEHDGSAFFGVVDKEFELNVFDRNTNQKYEGDFTVTVNDIDTKKEMLKETVKNSPYKISLPDGEYNLKISATSDDEDEGYNVFFKVDKNATAKTSKINMYIDPPIVVDESYIKAFEEMLYDSNAVWLWILSTKDSSNILFSSESLSGIIRECLMTVFRTDGVYSYFTNESVDDYLQVNNPYSDPQKKFEKYYKLDADLSDWIIKNVFDVEPDRNNADNDYYYSGDKLYILFDPGHDRSVFDYSVDKYEYMGNNQYKLTVTAQGNDYTGNNTLHYIFVAVPKIDEIHGKYWKLISYDSGEQEQPQEPELSLDTYYEQNFDSSMSGNYVYDFNQDGKDEMLVVDYSISTERKLSSCNLYLISENNGNAELISTYKINNSKFTDYGVFSDYDDKQYFEVYVNEKGYVSCNTIEKLNGCCAHYLIFDLSENTFNLKQHLLDPGYSSAIGVYYYDGYADDLKSAELFCNSENISITGKYSSYSEALEKELGVYGFNYTEMAETQGLLGTEYIVESSDTCKKILSYSTF